VGITLANFKESGNTSDVKERLKVYASFLDFDFQYFEFSIIYTGGSLFIKVTIIFIK